MEIRTFRKFVRQFEREVEREFKGESTCCGVTSVQCHTLLEVEALGSTNLANLADILALDKSTVSRTVDGLCKQGLLSRRINEENRRNIHVSLTKKGQLTCNQINEICDNYYFRIIKEIPKEKLNQIAESIEILTEILVKQRHSERCGCSENICRTSVSDSEKEI